MAKFYAWNQFRKWGVDVQVLCGEPFAAAKRYRVEVKDLPSDFQDRLRKDGFDVTQSVTLEAVIGSEGFGIEVDQDIDRRGGRQ
jgi:hypothetical protein